MFRDRDEELERLNRQLLEEDEENEDESEEEYQDESEEESEEEPEPQPDYDAYNADRADVDLEEFCRQLDAPPRRSGLRFVAIFFFLTALILLALALVIAYQRGML